MLEIERKFLLDSEPEIPETAEIWMINQVYLQSPVKGTTHRVRKVSFKDGRMKFFHTSKKKIAQGIHEEGEVEIDEITYNDMIEKLGDPKCVEIRKTRYIIPHGDFKLELDHFHSPVQFWMLEIELPEMSTPIEIPSWIPIEREVTEESSFSNRSIAGGSLNEII